MQLYTKTTVFSYNRIHTNSSSNFPRLGPEYEQSLSKKNILKSRHNSALSSFRPIVLKYWSDLRKIDPIIQKRTFIEEEDLLQNL